MIDRFSIRERPPGRPLMHQTWGKLLFMHWSFPPEVIRRLVPDPLTLDTFDDRAWVGITPFTMWGVRPDLLPAIPYVSRTHELNVRTYVHVGGVPGVWFFSLDAANPLAVVGARLAYALPYFQARMNLWEDGARVRFRSRRMHPGAPSANLDAWWQGGPAMGTAEPGSLDYFLTERYALYARRGRTLYRALIHHRPWVLRQATLLGHQSTMLQSHGIPQPSEPPLLHMQAVPLHVEVWGLKKVEA